MFGWLKKRIYRNQVNIVAYRWARRMDKEYPDWTSIWLLFTEAQRLELAGVELARAIDREVEIRYAAPRKLPKSGSNVSRKIPAYGTNVEIEGE